MGDVLHLKRSRGRPPAPVSADDLTLELSAIKAEALDLVATARPIVAQMAVIGINTSPAVAARAAALARLLDRTERRYGSHHLGGAA